MASTSNRQRYDVFLSFRGADTRKGFTDHLYAALLRSGVRAFRDNEEMEYGKEVGGECIKAIEESKCSIVVLSKGYASSTWCLDELLHIIEHSKITSHWVLPVFFDVDPSDVEQQTGTIKDAFDSHMTMFPKDKVQNWRMALTQAAYLKGIDLRNHEDGHEARNIAKIVRETLRKLVRVKLKVAIHPVDVDRPAHDVISLLGDLSSDVQIVGLYGMGGIGKTTIAKEVYNTIFEDFDGSCFLENINRKLSHDPIGLDKLQRQLLSQTLRLNYDEIYNVVLDPNLIAERLSGMRVFIVLDDVDNVRQFHQILGTAEWLFPGSKVIVTTRCKDFPEPTKFYEQYEVKELEMRESLQLLSLHAFGRQQPPLEYENSAYKIIYYAGGIPLALEVLGSSLKGQDVDVWNSRLEKLEKIIDKDIYRVLEISYQSLDDIDKRMFLDIACFFIGEEKNYVMSILRECGHFPIDGLNTLIRRSLVNIGSENELLMHDLIRDLGREIVRQESSSPGKRSRIWDHEDAMEVLMDETGKIEIEGLFLYGNWTTNKRRGYPQSSQACTRIKALHKTEDDVEVFRGERSGIEFEGFLPNEREFANNSIRTKAFKKMSRLKLLQLNYAHLVGSFHHISKNLRWLRWLKFPLDYIPHDLYLGKLVALDMTYSKLKEFPKDVEILPRLKFLNLSHSVELRALYNFERFCNLEVLTLDECISLVKLDESIEFLSHLVSLSLQRCTSLMSLPRNMDSLTSLENLNISGCSKLDEFSLNYVVNTRSNNAINIWSARDNNFPFPLSPSSDLHSHILDVFPSSLINLNLSCTNITTLPIQIGTQLPKLIGLWLNGCQKLKLVQLLPPSLMKLQAMGCTSLESIDLRNYVGDELDLRYCHKLKVISKHYKLETLQAETVRKVLNNSNLFTDNSFEALKIRIMNIVTETSYVRPIQGLLDNGVYNIFVPNIEIPSWFCQKNKGDSVDVWVHQSNKHHRIIGFIVAAVYGCNPPEYDLLASPGIGLFNSTTMNHSIFEPNFVFLPMCPTDSILWLSFWTNKSFFLEEGRLAVKIFMGDVNVRSCGIHLLYQDKHGQVDSFNPFDLPNVSSASLGLRQNTYSVQHSHARFSYKDNNEFVGCCASDDLLQGSLRKHMDFIRNRWQIYQPYAGRRQMVTTAKKMRFAKLINRRHVRQNERQGKMEELQEISTVLLEEESALLLHI